ncbi:MAG TPA: DUF4214 domain-containing protein [Gemmataceae bacterium]|jgi:hypothetical protein|nr:DUF4214 domain-containing protein [Gemmataceae bacterium]
MRHIVCLAGLLAAAVLPAFAQDRHHEHRYPERDYHWYHEAHRRAFPENPENLVRTWYEKYLNREPDPDGLSTWVGALVSGQSPESVLAGILNSDEYYIRAGNTPDGFIQKLFTDVVGRQPTPRELDYWMNRLYQSGRQDTAMPCSAAIRRTGKGRFMIPMAPATITTGQPGRIGAKVGDGRLQRPARGARARPKAAHAPLAGRG